jgi:hypothetical protein
VVLLEYGEGLYEEFEDLWFSYTGSSRKDLKPWHWKNCKISFEKNLDNSITFMVKRTKIIFLDDNTKLRWDKKQKTAGSKLNKYTLHYVIHFNVQIPLLPNMIHEEKIEEQRHGKKASGEKKDCWVLNLDNQHKIWKRKDEDNEARNNMMKILESIKIKQKSQQISPVDVSKRGVKANIMNIQVVVYHPARDLWGEHIRNYIQEIHIKRLVTENKILVTIVYNDERLREHAWLDWIYRRFRKLRHGRTFDVESFCIVPDKKAYPKEFDFPDIYSRDNKLEKDNIHLTKCGVTIKHYFGNNPLLPIVFINTSNHAMAEMDKNCNKWKIEYRIWEQQCPVYVGTNTRCEIEKYLSKHGIEPLLCKCKDSKYFICNE